MKKLIILVSCVIGLVGCGSGGGQPRPGKGRFCKAKADPIPLDMKNNKAQKVSLEKIGPGAFLPDEADFTLRPVVNSKAKQEPADVPPTAEEGNKTPEVGTEQGKNLKLVASPEDPNSHFPVTKPDPIKGSSQQGLQFGTFVYREAEMFFRIDRRHMETNKSRVPNLFAANVINLKNKKGDWVFVNKCYRASPEDRFHEDNFLAATRVQIKPDDTIEIQELRQIAFGFDGHKFYHQIKHVNPEDEGFDTLVKVYKLENGDVQLYQLPPKKDSPFVPYEIRQKVKRSVTYNGVDYPNVDFYLAVRYNFYPEGTEIPEDAGNVPETYP